MFSITAVAGVTIAALASSAAAADPTYSLVFNHQGANFFNNWNFYNGIDTNNTGNVLYQTKQQAQDLGLIGLNAGGNTIIKVDNKTSGVGNPQFGRPSVMMTSNYQLSAGNLLLFDAVHLPYGCSVWPAFWSQGQKWPDDGEIDIIEGVNLQKNNRLSLHTLNGCKHPEASSPFAALETGNLLSTDCFNQTNFNQGCIVEVPSTASYGADFAAAGGGVYAMLWNDTGISMWFFQRSAIPSDLPTDTPNPDAWPLPTAYYPTSSCDWEKFIKPQTLILDITICGNFALNVFNQTCSGNCLDLVQTPSNYDTAYFEISYIKVFQQTNGSKPSVTPEGTAAPTGTQSGSNPSKSPSTGGGSTGAASPVLSVSTITSLLSLLAALLFLSA